MVNSSSNYFYTLRAKIASMASGKVKKIGILLHDNNTNNKALILHLLAGQ